MFLEKIVLMNISDDSCKSKIVLTKKQFLYF